MPAAVRRDRPHLRLASAIGFQLGPGESVRSVKFKEKKTCIGFLRANLEKKRLLRVELFKRPSDQAHQTGKIDDDLATPSHSLPSRGAACVRERAMRCGFVWTWRFSTSASSPRQPTFSRSGKTSAGLRSSRSIARTAAW